MTQIQYAFIVKNSSLSSQNNKVSFESDAFASSFVGVASVDEACLVAKAFVDQGIDMIDLCSGFRFEDAKKVFDFVGGKTKISYAGISFS